jgi:inosose dehydratase
MTMAQQADSQEGSMSQTLDTGTSAGVRRRIPGARISCHLITWGEDLDTGLREASSLGYTACETFTHMAMVYEDRPQQLGELLQQHGMRLSALYGGGRFTDPEQRDAVVDYNARVARLIAANGGDRIVFGPAGPREPDGTPLEALRVAARTISEAAAACADLGVVACLHPHLWTEIQDRNELDAVMELTDAQLVKLAPDTAHLTRAGMDVAEVLRTYGDRVEYLHLKDLSPDDPSAEDFPMLSTGTEALPIFCELGLGTIDFAPIVDALEDIGYRGWLTVEIDQSTSTPLDSLRLCRDFVQNRLGIPLQG